VLADRPDAGRGGRQLARAACAGRLCWRVGGPADSYRDGLDPFTAGLGLVPYSNGVHDDFPGQPLPRGLPGPLVASGPWTCLAGGSGPGGGYTEDPIQPRLIW